MLDMVSQVRTSSIDVVPPPTSDHRSGGIAFERKGPIDLANPANYPIANSFCNCSKGMFLVSGTMVFTHSNWRHIMPAKNANT
jgi:hypothetical protein